jgi:hypothetical protein
VGVLVLLALVVPGAGGAATVGWSGHATCTIAISGPGYQHSETQRWQVNGPTTTRGAFLIVPSHWTDAGSGSSHAAQGNQTRDITWTVKAAAPGQFRFVVRASDGKLVIGQANAQLRVASGVTGTQRQTIGGVQQTPGAVDLEAFETQLPPIIVAGTVQSLSGSMAPATVKGSYGPFQPGAARVTKSCSWQFAKH